MKHSLNLLREHPAAIVVVVLIISILILALWRSADHKRALQNVASLQAQVNRVLGQERGGKVAEPALKNVDLETVKPAHEGISPHEGKTLSPPVCTFVRHPTFTARPEGRNVCEDTPATANSGDIACLSNFRIDREESGLPDMFSNGTPNSRGCLLTIWSETKASWKIKDVVIGSVPGASAMD